MDNDELQEIVSIILDQVVALKEENTRLDNKVKQLETTVGKLIDLYESLQNDYKDKMSNIATSLRIQDGGVNNMKYELNDPNIDREDLFYPDFYSIDETLLRIVSDRCSMARFGDGELAIMSGYSRQKFQKYDDTLRDRLIEVVNCDDSNFLVALANNYGSLDNYSRAGKSGIRDYMTRKIRLEHKKLLKENVKYHDAYISRPYVLYADNESDAPGKRFKKLKKIWNNRNIIIVEGSQTRMGIGNDLFDDAKSIVRIIGPAENAFSKYDDILKACLQVGCVESLFLIALGPSAGVLAYDLYKCGYQAIDIGHVDLEYEWYKRGQGKRVAVTGKYNNEFIGGEIVADMDDPIYRKQIIKEII